MKSSALNQSFLLRRGQRFYNNQAESAVSKTKSTSSLMYAKATKTVSLTQYVFQIPVFIFHNICKLTLKCILKLKLCMHLLLLKSLCWSCSVWRATEAGCG